MPKSRKVTKVDGRTVVTNAPTKLRIGSRKGGKSANLMSKDELEKVLADSGKKRYHDKARAALAAKS